MGIQLPTSAPDSASPETRAPHRPWWEHWVHFAPQSSLRDLVEASAQAGVASSLYLSISVEQWHTQPAFGGQKFLPPFRRCSLVRDALHLLFCICWVFQGRIT